MGATDEERRGEGERGFGGRERRRAEGDVGGEGQARQAGVESAEETGVEGSGERHVGLDVGTDSGWSDGGRGKRALAADRQSRV